MGWKYLTVPPSSVMTDGFDPSGSMVTMLPPSSIVTSRFTPLVELLTEAEVATVVVVSPLRSTVAAGLVLEEEPPVHAATAISTNTRTTVARHGIRLPIPPATAAWAVVNSPAETSDNNLDDLPIGHGWKRRERKAALLAGLIGGSVGVIAEVSSLMASDPGAPVRAIAYGLIAIVSLYYLMTSKRTEVPIVLAALTFGALSLIDAMGTMNVSGFDTGTTLAFLVLLSIIYVTTRASRTTGALIVGSTFIAVYAIAAVIIEQPEFSVAVSWILIGIPGQVLVIWLTWNLIESLAVASDMEATQSRIQHALARCSQVLLTSRDDDPLTAALDALLGATDADYAYIDVNRIDREGNVTWEIVADAVGANVPDGENAFDEGDYDQLEKVSEALAAGRPTQLITSELPSPIRDRYEAEGIKSELMAPILIRDQWVGTIGYSDFWRDGTWLPIEIEALTRAAAMVGAYWEREQAREGLEELAAAKDRFIATVSHELRTPLAAVVGFAGELAEGVDGYTHEEITEMVQLIASQSVEMAQLVDDLLTAERAAIGQPDDQARRDRPLRRVEIGGRLDAGRPGVGGRG